MKFIKKLITLFIEIESIEIKSLTPLEREKQAIFLIMFPF